MVECGSLRRYRFICGMTAIFLLNGLALAALSVVDKVIVSIYCIRRAVSYFYEMEFEIWTGFGRYRFICGMTTIFLLNGLAPQTSYRGLDPF